MQISPLFSKLVQSLQCLPGVGPKSSQRMALHLLQRDRQSGIDLANVLLDAMTNIGQCERCRTLTELKICTICNNSRRQENASICIVESPADIVAIEQTGQYAGQYFVLMGHLSPIDGIGPKDIGLNLLEDRLSKEDIKEVILATSPTIEGDATAYYIANICHKHEVPVTRIAHGVPVGGELEYVDGTTLSHSLVGRQKI